MKIAHPRGSREAHTERTQIPLEALLNSLPAFAATFDLVSAFSPQAKHVQNITERGAIHPAQLGLSAQGQRWQEAAAPAPARRRSQGGKNADFVLCRSGKRLEIYTEQFNVGSTLQ